jgi:hypothetical protein
MSFYCFEDCFFKLSDSLGVLYWFFVPTYFVCYILFDKNKDPDPLGRYGYLTEWGKAKYD